MPIDTKHDDYEKYKELQQRCDDAMSGGDVIKKAGEKYLPRLSGQSSTDYANYKNRALFYNASKRTVDGMSGALMRKRPTVKFFERYMPELDRIGTKDQTLTELITEAAVQVLTTGRLGLLVDVSENTESLEQDDDPYISVYDWKSIINWKEERIGSRNVLTRVVLQEVVMEEDPEDPYKMITYNQWRVLELVDSVYTQTVWKKEERVIASGGSEEVFVKTFEAIPSKVGGKRLDYIPFVFINPTTTCGDLENPPLIDLVNTNISHYHNTADLERGRHLTAIPTVVITGADSRKPGKSVRKIGGDEIWEIENPQARVFFLEFTGAGLNHLAEAQEEKQKQMAVLGAKILETQKTAVESAAALRIRHGSDNSTLSAIAHNLDRAFTKCLRWVADWKGLQEVYEDAQEIVVELNKDYENFQISPEVGNWLMSQVQAGIMSWDVYFYNLERGEVYPEGLTPDDERFKIVNGPVPMPNSNLIDAEETFEDDEELDENDTE